MDSNEGPSPRPRRPVLLPSSNRTLHHPSFMSLYMAVGFVRYGSCLHTHTVVPITPPEIYYTDPTMTCGSRIPNIVTEFGAFDCFQLNTPAPIMSACLAPPNRPDPFRSGTHSTRDLGSSTWRIHNIHPTTQPSRAVIELTQEEDEAITNLLTLHHHELLQGDETLTALHMDSSSVAEPLVDNMDTISVYSPSECTDSTSAEESVTPFYSDVQHPREAGLSDAEGDAVHVLLSLGDMLALDIVQ